MSKSSILRILCLGGTLVFGCDKDDTTPYEQPTTPSTTMPAAGGAEGTMNNAVESGNAAATATDTKANELLNQAMDYVKENKLDLAEKTLDQVAAMENLSPAMRGRLDTVRSALQAAKAKGDMKLPDNMPKMPS